MSSINELRKIFQDEILQNTVECRLSDGHPFGVKKEKQKKTEGPDAYPIFVIAKDGMGLLCSYEKAKPFRLRRIDSSEFIFDVDQPQKEYLFWITTVDGNTCNLEYLHTGGNRNIPGMLQIGYDENFVLNYGKNKVGIELEKKLKNEYVFQHNGKSVILLRRFANSDDNYQIVGLRHVLEIRMEDNKQIAKKSAPRQFPRSIERFTELGVMIYDSVDFVEKSKAREALEMIRSRAKKGSTILKLWSRYSEIEEARARKLKEGLGVIEFRFCESRKDGVTHVRFLFSQDQKNFFMEHKEDLERGMYEELTSDSMDAVKGRDFRYTIKNMSGTDVYLQDENYQVRHDGYLMLSTIGEEMVKIRRDNAREVIVRGSNLVLQNLYLAIEGEVSGMVERKNKREQPLTERTRKFLKKHFDIDDLTEDQKEAVSVALNTPDIVVIQGPPGTGKSTVVAAICDRLVEIAEKERKTNKRDKLILLSAFQNDTVEHIADKVYTLGLPTMKIGKESLGVKAEERFQQFMVNHIEDTLDGLSVSVRSDQTSKRLTEIRELLGKENDIAATVETISKIGAINTLSPELQIQWRRIHEGLTKPSGDSEKVLRALKKLRTTVSSYDDDGVVNVDEVRSLHKEINFTPEELDLLDNAPCMEPEEDFLRRLSELKEKYIERYANSTEIRGGVSVDLELWLEEAIEYAVRKEREQSCEMDDDSFVYHILKDIVKDLEGNSQYLREAIKSYSESLAATNQVAGGREMSEFSGWVENVVLEEAARSNPLDLIIPMTKATRRIIMVGDQKQLPHLLENDIADETVADFETAEEKNQHRLNLEESLFGIIYRNLSKASTKRYVRLTKQFRMHPAIGDFISKTYYEGNLESGMGYQKQAQAKQHPLTLPWAKSKVAVFCDVSRSKGKEERYRSSKCRSVEAQRIISLVKELIEDPQSEDMSIGVITFYSGQVQKLQELAYKERLMVMNPEGELDVAPHLKMTSDKREKFRIGSVDSFQGKEFDIVILSTVRSNDMDRVPENFRRVYGFLTLENRLNVAFSRAQRLIIVVGDKEMFNTQYASEHVPGLYRFVTELADNTEYGNNIR